MLKYKNGNLPDSRGNTLLPILGLVSFLFTGSLFSEGTYSSAVERYKKSDWKGTIEEIRKIHDGGGASYETHALCAYAYSKLDDFASSSAHFFQAIKLKPEDPRVRADIIRLYLNHGKSKGALELATEAIEKFSDDPEIQFLYATTLFERGKPKTALTRVERLKTIRANDPEILNLEGRIYFALGNFEKADVSLKWASALSPDSASIWNNLAITQEKLYLYFKKAGKKSVSTQYLQESKDSIQKAVSLDAKDTQISKNAERILGYTP